MSPLQLTVRSISDSPTIDFHVNKHFEKLKKIFSKINNCRVVIDLQHKHKHKGKLFSVSIDMTVPGKELVCKKEDENIYAAIRESFFAMEKLLEKYCKKKSSTLDKYVVNYQDSHTEEEMLEDVS